LNNKYTCLRLNNEYLNAIGERSLFLWIFTIKACKTWYKLPRQEKSVSIFHIDKQFCNDRLYMNGYLVHLVFSLVYLGPGFDIWIHGYVQNWNIYKHYTLCYVYIYSTLCSSICTIFMAIISKEGYGSILHLKIRVHYFVSLNRHF
jgi:hypothetical protein